MLLQKVKTEYISVALLVFTLAPFLILCCYVQPSLTDEYCFATKTLEFGLLSAFRDWYINWTGRYSLFLLMSINPLVFKSFVLYKIQVLIFISSLPILIFILFKSIFHERSRSFYIGFTSLFTFLFFSELPNINEGLYWMTGAIAYQLPNIGTIVLLISIVNIINNKRILTNTILGCIAIILITGCNEISMAMLAVFLFLLTGYNFYLKATRKYLFSLFLIIGIFASFCVVLAPGNDFRESLFPNRNQFPIAAFTTFLGTGYYLFKWLGITCLTIILSLYLLSKEPLAKNVVSFTLHPILSLLSFICILIAGFFVPCWATGQMPNPRAINVLFFIFLLGTFYHTIIFYYYFAAQKIFVGKTIAIITSISILLITLNPDKQNKNNIKIAYIDLLSGKAYRYNQQFNKMYRTGIIPVLSTDNIPISLSHNTNAHIQMDLDCTNIYFRKYYKNIHSDN